MEIILAIAGFICLLVGLAGAVLPLPGPPLSFLGLILLNFSSYFGFSESILWLFGILSLAVVILDYYVPIWGTKRFGGSNYGVVGSALGLIAGLFLGPFGIFIGAFAGAFLGEMLKIKNQQIALKAALGSFVGLMAGMVVKIVLCLAMLIYSIIEIVKIL